MEIATCVVMASFNGERFIEQQINSILDQTVAPQSILIRDDASTDDTIRILRDIKARAPEDIDVNIIEGDTNLGYKRNFISALTKARADIYFFADQDDVWYPEKIARHLEVYKNSPSALLVVSNQDIVDQHLRPTGRTTLDEVIRRRGNSIDFVHGCCTSFSHKIHDIACRPIEELAHDDWVHLISECCDGRHVIADPLQAFRRHPQNTTSSDVNSVQARKRRVSVGSRSAVARNLDAHARAYRSASDLIKSAETLEAATKAGAVARAEARATKAEERSARLKSTPLSAVFKTLFAIARRKQPVKQGFADVLRSIKP